MKVRLWLVTLLGGLALLIGTAVTAAPGASASTYASGQVQCLTMPVEGVWVAANSGGSGWASWHTFGDPEVANFSYSLPNGGSYYVHVGCGGSPQHWAVATYSYNAVTGSGHVFYCYDYSYEDPYYGHCTNS